MSSTHFLIFILKFKIHIQNSNHIVIKFYEFWSSFHIRLNDNIMNELSYLYLVNFYTLILLLVNKMIYKIQENL
jgi:hypothetical protein